MDLWAGAYINEFDNELKVFIVRGDSEYEACINTMVEYYTYKGPEDIKFLKEWQTDPSFPKNLRELSLIETEKVEAIKIINTKGAVTGIFNSKSINKSNTPQG